MPSKSKKPKTSVKVVMMIDEATAGSIPTRFKNRGMAEPAIPAMIKLPVIARKITNPSIGF